MTCALPVLRFTLLLLSIVSCAACAADVERTGGPYVPTPQAVVDAMLEFARVGPRDFVVDLGSGDGRIVLTAAARYKARGFGVEIDPELVSQSNEEAKKRSLSDRASFREEDVLKAKIDEATVVTLYLLPGMMQQLQAKFSKELRPGTRIVSHDFTFAEWKPDREKVIDVPEKYGTSGQWKSTLFYWVVPAHVHGSWQLSAPGVLTGALPLALDQKYQVVHGAVIDKGRRLPLAAGRVEADRIAFRLALPSGTTEFRGVVEGSSMHGEALREGRSVPWSAVKSPAAPG